MSYLASKIQNAAEGSRELSDDVIRALGWRECYSHEGGILLPDMWVAPDGSQVPGDERPDPTRNLQDAVSLALKNGATVIRSGWRKGELAKASLGFPWDEGVLFTGAGYTLALACSESIVKAYEAKAEAA